MRIRYQADNDLKSAIVKGVKRREPAVDFRTARSACLDATNDLIVLDIAAKDGRVLVSHDVTTMIVAFQTFIQAGNACPGVFLVPQGSSIRETIESLLYIWEESEAGDWEGRIAWLPL